MSEIQFSSTFLHIYAFLKLRISEQIIDRDWDAHALNLVAGCG